MRLRPFSGMKRVCLDGVQRAGADVLRAVHADEPLRGGAVDQRGLGAPGVGVGVHQLGAGEQGAGLGQGGADGVGGLVDVDAGETGDPGVEGAVVADGLGDLQAVGAAEGEVVLAVGGGGVDQAGALLGGDVVAEQEGDVEVVAVAAQGVVEAQAGERRAGQGAQDRAGGDAGVGADLGEQGLGDDDAFAGDGERALGGGVDLDEGVVDLGAGGDGAVGGDGPRRRGPDHDGGAGEVGVGGRGHGEADPDRGGGVVVVLDLGLGERGLLHGAPHHRAQAAVEGAVEQEAADLGGDGGLGGEVHGGVAVGPVALHAEAAELGGLDVEPLLGVGAALGAELQDGDVVLVAAGLAVGFLDLPLDRQAVAVPAGDVERVEAGHLAGAVDDVLVDLVQRVADVQVAVGVRRAVVQQEGRAAGAVLAQAGVQVVGVPAGEDLGFLRGQAAAHREGGRGEEHGVAVVARGGGVGHGASHRKEARPGSARTRQGPGPLETATRQRQAGGSAAPACPGSASRVGNLQHPRQDLMDHGGHMRTGSARGQARAGKQGWGSAPSPARGEPPLDRPSLSQGIKGPHGPLRVWA